MKIYKLFKFSKRRHTAYTLFFSILIWMTLALWASAFFPRFESFESYAFPFTLKGIDPHKTIPWDSGITVMFHLNALICLGAGVVFGLLIGFVLSRFERVRISQPEDKEFKLSGTTAAGWLIPRKYLAVWMIIAVGVFAFLCYIRPVYFRSTILGVPGLKAERSDYIRMYTATWFARNPNKKALPHLIKSMNSEKHKDIKHTASVAVAKLGDPAALKNIILYRYSNDTQVRFYVDLMLRNYKSGVLSKYMVKVLKEDKDWEHRLFAALMLGRMPDPGSDAVKALLDCIDSDGSPSVIDMCAVALGRLEESDAVTPLVSAYISKYTSGGGKDLLRALGRIDLEKSSELLVERLANPADIEEYKKILHGLLVLYDIDKLIPDKSPLKKILTDEIDSDKTTEYKKEIFELLSAHSPDTYMEKFENLVLEEKLYDESLEHFKSHLYLFQVFGADSMPAKTVKTLLNIFAKCEDLRVRKEITETLKEIRLRVWLDPEMDEKKRKTAVQIINETLDADPNYFFYNYHLQFKNAKRLLSTLKKAGVSAKLGNFSYIEPDPPLSEDEPDD